MRMKSPLEEKLARRLAATQAKAATRKADTAKELQALTAQLKAAQQQTREARWLALGKLLEVTLGREVDPAECARLLDGWREGTPDAE